jgi:hypothetical protein
LGNRYENQKIDLSVNEIRKITTILVNAKENGDVPMENLDNEINILKYNKDLQHQLIKKET